MPLSSIVTHPLRNNRIHQLSPSDEKNHVPSDDNQMNPLNLLASDLVTKLTGQISDDNSQDDDSDSIFAHLKKYITAEDYELDPNPHLNNVLHTLVSYLQGRNLTYSNESKCSFARLEKLACALIDTSPVRTARAAQILHVACRAESNLEMYYAKRLINSDISFSHDSNLSPVQRIQQAAFSFPYIENYVEMVQVESQYLTKFVRKPMKDCQIVFCGSGPLPLSGVLLAAVLGCSVVLVDCDENAVNISSQLIQFWERRNVLPYGRISVLKEDCMMLKFNDRHHEIPSILPLFCDVVFVAALIPHDAKIAVATTASKVEEKSPLLAVRSAHGLTARFAYSPLPVDIIEKVGLSHVGTLAPCVHNLGDGSIVDGIVKPIALFPDSILNSLELFQRHASF